MRILTVNVGRAQPLEWKGATLSSGIVKRPVDGEVRVGPLGLEGDEQADHRVHGGEQKAVYVYPHEHYDFWSDQLPDAELPPGAFGENLTTKGVLETELRIGDRLTIGSALFSVTQPRLPCVKLAARFGTEDLIQRFLESRRTGFYLSVVRTGMVWAGAEIVIWGRAVGSVTVQEAVRLYDGELPDRDLLNRALRQPSLPASWRDRFARRLQVGGSEEGSGRGDAGGVKRETGERKP